LSAMFFGGGGVFFLVDASLKTRGKNRIRLHAFSSINGARTAPRASK
jgi:hypothetical protein